MTNKKLIERMRNLLDLDRRRQKKKIDKLEALVAKLDKRRRELDKELDKEKKADRKKRLERDLRVLSEQRKKGLKLLEKLKKDD